MGVGADQRIALVLEANDQASAILAKVRAQVAATRDAAGAAGDGLNGAADGATKLGNSEHAINKAGRAMSSIAFAASQAQLGTKGAVMAIGSLAETAAAVTPALAAWAIPIGAAVALLGTALSIMQDTTAEQDHQKKFQDRLAGQTLEGLRRIDAQLSAARDHKLELISQTQIGLLERAGGLMDLILSRGTQGAMAFRDVGMGADLDQTLSDKEAVFKARQAAEQQERIRLITLGDQTREMIRQKQLTVSTAETKLRLARGQITTEQSESADARAQLATQNAAVEAMFRRRDAVGNLVALTKEENGERSRLLGLDQQLYQQTLLQVRVKAEQHAKDARFAVNTRLAVLSAQANRATDPELQLLQAQIDLQQRLIELKKSGDRPGDQNFQEHQENAAYEAQKEIINQSRKAATDAARADRHANSDNPMEALQGKLDHIQMAKDADIKAGVDVTEATANAEQKKRQLYRDTYSQAIANAQQFSSILIGSKNKELKAIGQAMDGVRRVVLGYEAAEATVNALKYGAKAIGYAADMQWVQAGQAAAAALEFAKTAAVAGQGAMGGAGGAAGGSGGGSGGSYNAGTFEPRSATNGGGMMVVNLITRDPYGRDSIQQTMYAINRSQLLGRPAIEVPPTTGIRSAA